MKAEAAAAEVLAALERACPGPERLHVLTAVAEAAVQARSALQDELLEERFRVHHPRGTVDHQLPRLAGDVGLTVSAARKRYRAWLRHRSPALAGASS